MHERSLVRQLIDQVCRVSKERRLGEIKEIHLQIGEFSGVEPRLVQSAFEELALMTWPYQVGLKMETVPLSAKCSECDCQFLVKSFRFVCPECGAGDVQIASGEELQLVSLTAKTKSYDRGATR